MDFGFLGKIEFTPEFLAAFLSITLIDLVLAGDNAVVIAMAVQNLQGKQRKWGIILGAGAQCCSGWLRPLSARSFC